MRRFIALVVLASLFAVGCGDAKLSAPLKGSNKTYSVRSSSCKIRKQMTQAARVSQASWMTPRRS